LPACGNFGKDDQQLISAAAVYLDQGDVSAAIIEYKNVLQRHPDNAEARFRLANIYLDYHDNSSAEKEFRYAAKAGWDPAQACYGLARVLLGLGKFKQLINDCPVEAAFPATAQANLTALHAAALAALGEKSAAMQTLQQAEAIQADALQVMQTRIEFLLIAGEHAEADKLIARAQEHFPDNPVFILQRAARLVQQGDDSWASHLLQGVIERDPPGHISGYGRRARLTLARLKISALQFQAANDVIKPLYGRDPESNYLGSLIAFREGNLDLAEQHILKVLKQAPGYQSALLLYGAINYAQQDYEQATYYLSKYVAAVPTNLGARKLLSQAHMKLGQFDEARSSLVTAVNEETDDAGLLALVGVSALRSGNNKAGLLNLEQAVAAAPDSASLRGELARAYLASGDVERAIEELQTILQGDNHPQEAEILLTLAHLRAENTGAALVSSSQLLKNSPDDPAILTLAGNVQEASGDIQTARTRYQRALQMVPDYIPATMSLGRLEEQAGNTDQAMALYRASAESSHSDTRPLLALARLAEASGDTAAMVDWLQQARQRSAGELGARIILGEYYLQARKPQQAMQAIEEAAAIAPANPRLLVMRARVAMMQGDYDAALTPLKTLLQTRPESPVAHALLGENLLRLERYEEAREQMAIVLQAYPDNSEALILAADIELRSGASDKAVQLAKQLQQSHPDNAVGYEIEGNIWMARKEYVRASKAYRRAGELQPGASLAIKQSGALKRTERQSESVTPLLDWLQGHPDNLAVRQALGTAWMELGENDKAIAAYLQVLDKAPDSLVALNNLAWLYQLAGNPLALKTARHAYQLDGEDPGVVDTYGWLLVQNDEAEQGRTLLARALQQLPDVAEVQYHYAVALLRVGDTTEAVGRLEKLLADDQDFTGRSDAQQLLDEYRG